MDEQKRLALELALEDRLRADLGELSVRPYAYYKEAVLQRSSAKPSAIGDFFVFLRAGAAVGVAVLFALGVAVLLLNLRAPSPAASPTPIAAPSTTATPSASPTPTATPTPSPALMLHWMSFEANDEPHHRLVYEGGTDAAFTDVRLLAPDGTVVAQAAAVPTASEAMRMCARPVPFGPTRATLALPTAELLSDVIRRPEAYRVEARIAGEWKVAAAVNECHMQQ
jgi:hypothetical protein